MMNYEVILADSLEKILPSGSPRPLAEEPLIVWPGETVSFQAAARLTGGSSYEIPPLTLQVYGDISVRTRRAEYMSALFAAPIDADENYLTRTAAMLPDPLVPQQPGEPFCFRLIGGQWDICWCDWKVPEDQPAGKTAVKVAVADADGAEIFCREVCFDVQMQPLPAQTLLHTQWFHTDCLADYYGVQVWSEEHWRIVENFISSAADHGINMLLTPLFTPALDTAVGAERTTCQLLKIDVIDGEYRFDFSLLDRWIDLCRKHGITELEICHLFTQWGAVSAPKVVAVKDGKLQRIFGWDTPAVGGEYTCFLRRLLPELKAHLAARGMLEHTWFHISDEPTEACLTQWKAAHDSVADLLEDCRMLDALSSIAYYRQGLVRTPVAANDSIETFAEDGVKDLWTYYCIAQYKDVPNRFMAMPSARTRILGVLLYRYDLAGFLHWGFNFYNGDRSRFRIDPWKTADGGGSWPAGDPFLVYPGADGTAVDSIRGMLIREAMQDLRLLRLAEQCLGRPAVLELLNKLWGGKTMTMKQYPTDPLWFAELRRAVSGAMKEENEHE